MKKIFPYKIYHLDHELLIALERAVKAGETSDQDIKAVQVYKELMSNKPRFDPTIRKCFGLKEKTIEDVVGDIQRDLVKIEKTKLNRKIISAGKLLEQGFYKLVADVDMPTAKAAILATTSINKEWMFKPSKKVIPTEIAWRSTDSYDVIQRFDECFLSMPLGFIDLQKGDYVNELI